MYFNGFSNSKVNQKDIALTILQMKGWICDNLHKFPCTRMLFPSYGLCISLCINIANRFDTTVNNVRHEHYLVYYNVGADILAPILSLQSKARIENLEST